MNKKQYVLIVLLALVAGLVGGIGSTQLISKYWHSKQIKAESFVVVDQQGRERGFFRITDDPKSANFPVLQLSDNDGRPGIFITVDENGKGDISFWGDKGNHINLDLGLHENGMPFLYFLNADAKNLGLMLMLDDEGLPSLRFSNRDLMRRLELCIREDRPYISVFDKDNNPIWTAPSAPVIDKQLEAN